MAFHFAGATSLKKEGWFVVSLGDALAKVLAESPNNIHFALMWYFKLEVLL